MERVAFLIEKSNMRISCLLNPEDGQDSFVVERTSGAARDALHPLSRSKMTDNPVVFNSRGDTRLTLRLLFDVTLAGSSIQTVDVRHLTSPIWQLAEYVQGMESRSELPRARFIWGRAWDIPVVVESVAERFERFTPEGYPQRSWMTLRLLRLSDELPAAEPPRQFAPADIPETADLPPSDPDWGVHEVIGSSAPDRSGEALWQIAFENYGDPSLWRLLARANDIDNPASLEAGTLLKIPPLSVLRSRKWTQ